MSDWRVARQRIAAASVADDDDDDDDGDARDAITARWLVLLAAAAAAEAASASASAPAVYLLRHGIYHVRNQLPFPARIPPPAPAPRHNQHSSAALCAQAV